MKPLSQYPIYLPFNSTVSPYSGINPHHGIDIAAPIGTPIDVNGVIIGYVGSTGESTGPHTHIDKNKQLWVTEGYVNPADWKTTTGVVVAVGDFGTAGLAVVIQADNGYFYRFLHMSKINAKEGQKIGGNMLTNKNHLKVLFRQFVARDPKSSEYPSYIGKDASVAYEKLHRARIDLPTVLKERDSLRKQLAEVKTALANEKAKPPKEVIKTVEKIVEKPVPVEVKVGEEEAVRGFFQKLLDLIFKKS